MCIMGSGTHGGILTTRTELAAEAISPYNFIKVYNLVHEPIVELN